jgi:hypothetical protein
MYATFNLDNFLGKWKEQHGDHIKHFDFITGTGGSLQMSIYHVLDTTTDFVS